MSTHGKSRHLIHWCILTFGIAECFTGRVWARTPVRWALGRKVMQCVREKGEPRIPCKGMQHHLLHIPSPLFVSANFTEHISHGRGFRSWRGRAGRGLRTASPRDASSARRGQHLGRRGAPMLPSPWNRRSKRGGIWATLGWAAPCTAQSTSGQGKWMWSRGGVLVADAFALRSLGFQEGEQFTVRSTRKKTTLTSRRACPSPPVSLEILSCKG